MLGVGHQRAAALLLPAVLGALAACGSSDGRISKATESTVTARAASTSSTLLMRVSELPRATCSHQPVDEVINAYPRARPDPPGPTLDYAEIHGPGFKRGVNGNSIRPVGESGERLEWTRPDGTVTLVVSNDHSVSLEPAGLADFDGDSREDALIGVSRPGTMSAVETTYYIVPGSGPLGEQNPTAIGVRVPIPARRDVSQIPEPVGDQDRDGGDDLSFNPLIFSGMKLAVGRRERPGAPIIELPRRYIGVLQLDDERPPVFVIPDEKSRSLVLSDGSARLALGHQVDADKLINGQYGGSGISAWLVDGNHVIEFGRYSRGGDTYLRGNLDGPCES